MSGNPGELTGRVLEGRFQVGQRIGSGGMGHVYLATDRSGRIADPVVKVPRDLVGDDGMDKFRRESERHRRLAHPAIVPVYHVGECDDLPYLVMKFMRGGSLGARIDPEGGRSVASVFHWLLPVAEALDYMHRQGLCHRDVKPTNILFESEAPDAVAMLADFGIAKADDLHTETTGIPGTYDWMPPEATDAKYGPQYDQYSLAMVVYRALCGQVAGDGPNDLARFLSRRTGKYRDLHEVAPQVDEGISAVVMKALGVHPWTRYGSCGAFARALADHEAELSAPRRVREGGEVGSGTEMSIGGASAEPSTTGGAFAEGPIPFNRASPEDEPPAPTPPRPSPPAPTPTPGLPDDGAIRWHDEIETDGDETVVRGAGSAAYLKLATRREQVDRKPMPRDDHTVLRKLVVPRKKARWPWIVGACIFAGVVGLIAVAANRRRDAAPEFRFAITSPSEHRHVMDTRKDSVTIEGICTRADIEIRTNWTVEGREPSASVVLPEDDREGKKWFHEFKPPGDGLYTLRFWSDLAEGSVSQDLQVLLDRTEPKLDLEPGSSEDEYRDVMTGNPKIHVVASDTWSEPVTLEPIPHADISDGGHGHFRIEVLRLGRGDMREVEIRARDACGNSTSIFVEVSRRSKEAPPPPPLEKPAPLDWLVHPRPRLPPGERPREINGVFWFGEEEELCFEGRLKAESPRVWYRIYAILEDGSQPEVVDFSTPEMEGEGAFLISGLEVPADGVYAIEISASKARSVDTKVTTVKFGVDTKAPVLTHKTELRFKTVLERRRGGDVYLHGTVDDRSPSQVTWILEGTVKRDLQVPPDGPRRVDVVDGKFEIQIERPPQGQYKITLRAVDMIGHWSDPYSFTAVIP